jgi:hypothetical protein
VSGRDHPSRSGRGRLHLCWPEMGAGFSSAHTTSGARCAANEGGSCILQGGMELRGCPESLCFVLSTSPVQPRRAVPHLPGRPVPFQASIFLLAWHSSRLGLVVAAHSFQWLTPLFSWLQPSSTRIPSLPPSLPPSIHPSVHPSVHPSTRIHGDSHGAPLPRRPVLLAIFLFVLGIILLSIAGAVTTGLMDARYWWPG